MTKHIKLQKDYTASCLYYQIKLPLDIEKNIPSDDPVRLLSTFVEGMKLSDLYNTYGKIKKDQVSPKQLLKIVIYAGMNRIYSSRDIEKSCRQDINFMYLLEGKPFPNHATIARFISLHLSQCSSNILAEVSNILYELGGISGRHIFIDGTKIESAANRYTFVWKKAVTKNQTKLFAKIEQRNKTLYVSKTMKQKRAEDFERITSPYGIQLRVNRSIQAERSFASVKQDMEFRRYMYRGKENVTAQSVILAIAHNINKLHNKIQSEKTGQHLFRLKETA